MNTNRINEIIERMDSFKESHPNMHALWSYYLNLKVKALNDCILQCENICNTIDTIPNDPDPETLITLITFSRLMSENTA